MEEAGVYASQSIGGYDRAEVNSSIEQKDSHAQYTIQSVLHFIQSEWTRLELQRSQWEMERAELQVHHFLYAIPCSGKDSIPTG